MANRYNFQRCLLTVGMPSGMKAIFFFSCNNLLRSNVYNMKVHLRDRMHEEQLSKEKCRLNVL